jgi:hypothetical protein
MKASGWEIKWKFGGDESWKPVSRKIYSSRDHAHKQAWNFMKKMTGTDTSAKGNIYEFPKVNTIGIIIN